MLSSDVDSHTGGCATADLPAASDAPQQRALPQQHALRRPGHSFGADAAIKDLMNEAALTPGQSHAAALQAYQWIMQAIHRHVRTAQSLPECEV
jgi:hypothetical protein